jgi:hypothetical protein
MISGYSLVPRLANPRQYPRVRCLFPYAVPHTCAVLALALRAITCVESGWVSSVIWGGAARRTVGGNGNALIPHRIIDVRQRTDGREPSC